MEKLAFREGKNLPPGATAPTSWCGSAQWPHQDQRSPHSFHHANPSDGKGPQGASEIPGDLLESQFLTQEFHATAKSLQSCPTLCDLIDGSPLGSSVPGILQARILEWVAISFSNA